MWPRAETALSGFRPRAVASLERASMTRANDHGDDQIALAGGGTSDEGMEGRLLEGAEDGSGMPMRGTASDGQQVVRGARRAKPASRRIREPSTT